MPTSRSVPSTSLTARQTLDTSLIISQRLRDALFRPGLLLLHRSQWQCLASSYCAVTEALVILFEHACSVLEPLEQESLCRKLTRPLRALHQAVHEGETCMQESLPSSSTSTHSWLLEKALKQGMSTELVDFHLHRLLWTSSIVSEQILRCAPAIESNIFLIQLSEHTKHLCDIWSHMDKEDDLLTARSLVNGIMGKEEGDTRQLASFILQRLSCPELSSGRITDSKDLPPFLWVDPKDFERKPKVIGGGSCAYVQEADWLGGRFAVKEFHHVEDMMAFGGEATIQAQLHHPNVMSLVCCSPASGPLETKCSLIMERMQGDLHAFIIQRKQASGMESPLYDLLLAVDLMLQVAQGIEYLHSDSLRVIHRDLKSSNILFSLSSCLLLNDANPCVHLKVADFGMSKVKYTSSKFTTMQVGTTPWRAPEVFDVNPEDELLEEGSQPSARYTNKADVYSFGMLCYEILAGKAPFEGLKLADVRRRVLSGDRPSLPSHCPVALASYIQMCWQENPMQRPTFTQICTMLRYFKACIFMGDHARDENAAEYNNWLLHPRPTTMCARIDDMLQSSLAVQGLSGLLWPQLLIIPLEMFYCRVVLQQTRCENGTTNGFNSPARRKDGSHELVPQERRRISQQSGDEIDLAKSFSFHEAVSSVKPYNQRKAGKGFFNSSWRWLKKLPSARQSQSQRAEVRSSIGLVGDFSYKELCRATNNFSDIIGSGGFSKVYRGQLMNGQSIAVKVLWSDSFANRYRKKFARFFKRLGAGVVSQGRSAASCGWATRRKC